MTRDLSNHDVRTILVIEDDSAFAELLRQALSQEGFTSFVEADGESGLKAFQEQSIDLIILDVLVPKIQGFDFLVRLRSMERGEDVPVIVVSGVYRSATYRHEMVSRYHLVEYLDKPVDMPQLLALIRRSTTNSGVFSRGPIPATDLPATDLPATDLPADAMSGQLNESPLRGDLRDTSFARLLAQLLLSRSTGSLLLRKGPVKKIIHIRDGVPIYVKSNLLSECLGPVMVAERLISQEDCDRALELRRLSGKKHGEVLVEMGAISPHNLGFSLELQLQRKLFDVFGWPEGRYQFSARASHTPHEEVIALSLSPLALIYEGVRHGMSEERLNAELASYAGVVVASEEPTLRYQALELEPRSLALIEHFDGTQTIQDLLSMTSFDRKGASAFLYALLCVGLIRLEPFLETEQTFESIDDADVEILATEEIDTREALLLLRSSASERKGAALAFEPVVVDATLASLPEVTNLPAAEGASLGETESMSSLPEVLDDSLMLPDPISEDSGEPHDPRLGDYDGDAERDVRVVADGLYSPAQLQEIHELSEHQAHQGHQDQGLRALQEIQEIQEIKEIEEIEEIVVKAVNRLSLERADQRAEAIAVGPPPLLANAGVDEVQVDIEVVIPSDFPAEVSVASERSASEAGRERQASEEAFEEPVREPSGAPSAAPSAAPLATPLEIAMDPDVIEEPVGDRIANMRLEGKWDEGDDFEQVPYGSNASTQRPNARPERVEIRARLEAEYQRIVRAREAELEAGHRPLTTSRQAAIRAQEANERALRELEALYRELSAKTYYEILDVPVSAHNEEIRSAYQRLARQMDPSRTLPVPTSAEVRKLGEKVFLSLMRALSTLTHAEARKAYDREISGDDGSAEAVPIRAEILFQEGIQAAGDSEWALAKSLFREAMELMPTVGIYTAHYAWASFTQRPDDADTRLEVIELLDQAIQLSPETEQGYLFRGMVNKRCGRRPEALRDFELALHHNPDSVFALTEIRDLEPPAPKKTGILSRFTNA